MSANDQLFQAIANHDYAEVQNAIQAGADIHVLSDEGQTVLHATINSQSIADERLIQQLVDAGADVNARNRDGQTPLDYALRAPHVLHHARFIGEDGEPVGEEQPAETTYKASPRHVMALFKHNAKATNHAEKILEIRKTICGAGHFLGRESHIERNLMAVEKRLAAQKDPKHVPPLDSPAYDFNTDDPFYAFAQCYNHMGAVASAISGQNGLPALLNLVAHSKEKSWEDYAAKLPEQKNDDIYYSVRDLKQEFCKQVVAPALLRGLSPDSLTKATNNYLGSLVTLPLDESIPKLLTTNRSAEQLIEMADSYHRQVTALHDKTNLRIDELDWHPLITESKSIVPALEGLEGWRIEQLTTGRELREEGRAMNHCVGGYASSCMMGNSHILSIRDAEGRSISTAEVAPAERAEHSPFASTALLQPNGKSPYAILQHYGPANTSPSADAGRVLDWFKEQVKSGEIALQSDPERLGGKEGNAAWKNTTPLEQILYHNQSDMTAERQQKLFDLMVGNDDEIRIRCGRRNYLIPSAVRKMPVEQFLEESGINRAISNVCKMFQLDYTPTMSAAKSSSWQQRIAQFSTHEGRTI